jgi:hypothetical protein
MPGKAGAFPGIFDAASARFSSNLFNESLIRDTSDTRTLDRPVRGLN